VRVTITAGAILHVVWRIVIVGACAYVLFILLVLLFQGRFMFYPVRSIEDTPRDVLLDYDDVHFATADGVKLHGWFVPARNGRGVVLFCHGNAGNISHRLMSIQVFHQLGLSTFIFDYRGYGRSEGKPSEQGMYADSEAAWRYLVDVRGVEPGRIVVFGRSLGGAIATRLAAIKTPAGLIAESTFTSMGDLAADLYPVFPMRWLIRAKFPTADYIRRVRCPILLVHGRDDKLISSTHSEVLLQAAPEGAQLLELKGGHNDAFYQDLQRYTDTLDEFLGRILGGAAEGPTTATADR